MSLASYALAAMTSFVPVSAHSSFEPEAVTVARYDAIAADISTAATEAPVAGLDASRTAVLLAAVASFESAFSARVDSCTVHGGSKAVHAWGLWQAQRPKGEVCGSRLDAARLAIRMIGDSFAGCRRWPLSIYTVGSCRDDAPARWRHERAKRFWIRNVFRLDEIEGPS